MSRFLIAYKPLAKEEHRKVSAKDAKVSNEPVILQGEKRLQHEEKGELEGLGGRESKRNVRPDRMRKDRAIAVQ